MRTLLGDTLRKSVPIIITIPGMVNVSVGLKAAQWDRSHDLMNEIVLSVSTKDRDGHSFIFGDWVYKDFRETVRTGDSMVAVIKVSPRFFNRRLLSISAKEYDMNYDALDFDWLDVIPTALQEWSADRIAKNEVFDLKAAAVQAANGHVVTITRRLASNGILTAVVSAEASEKLLLSKAIERAHNNCAQLERDGRFSGLTYESKYLLQKKTMLLLEVLRENGAGDFACADLKLP